MLKRTSQYCENLPFHRTKTKNIDHVLSIKAASDEVKTNFEDPEFTGIVKALKHHINIGDVFQIVPSRRFPLLARIH